MKRKHDAAFPAEGSTPGKEADDVPCGEEFSEDEFSEEEIDRCCLEAERQEQPTADDSGRSAAGKSPGRRPSLTYNQNHLKQYLTEMGGYDMLSREEVQRLAVRARAGDEEAAERLTEGNLRLVISIAKRYRFSTSMELMDLIEEGNIGLMKAVKKYDPAKGYMFSTYATWWIRQSIFRAIADQDLTIRIPAHMSEHLNKLRRAESRLRDLLQMEPTEEELAEEMGVSVARVRYLKGVMKKTYSLESRVGEEEDSEMGWFIADASAEDPFEKAFLSCLRDLIAKILDEFQPREQTVIRLRFGFVNGRIYTLEEVGRSLGITRERVRQIEQKTLRLLGHPRYVRLFQTMNFA